MSQLQGNPDWLRYLLIVPYSIRSRLRLVLKDIRLQRKIFSRWVNLKLSKRGIAVKDIVRRIIPSNEGSLICTSKSILPNYLFLRSFDVFLLSRPSNEI